MSAEGRPGADAGLREVLLERLVRITETAAPPFGEERRGALIEELWRAAGHRVERDDVGNVIAEGALGTEGPRVLVAAHLDTVFGPEVEVRVRRDEDAWRAPGIGDNSASLAVLTVLAERAAAQGDGRRLPRVTLAATVGEEGLGDLRGARRLVAERAAEHDVFIALDGHLGTVVARAVGSKRFEARLQGAGGHSWGDYPSPSAVHAAGEAVVALTRLDVPDRPRSSLNVGQIWGGTSVNAIAQEAGFNLDLRSLDPDVLAGLEHEARRAVLRAARRHGCTVTLEPVGDRPAAHVPNEALVRAARGALEAVGVEPRVVASSTDANAAMAAGMPAIAFGVYRGGDAHRHSEWIEPDSLCDGYAAFLGVLGALAQG